MLVIASIKARLKSIRPRARIGENLQNNIENAIDQLGNFNEYIRDQNMEVIHWPLNISDVNIIENI